MSELEQYTSWTFTFQLNTPPKEIVQLLLPDEQVEASFKTIRDVAAFTNKRLIVMDAQGLRGKKKELYSLPYKSIVMWSTENAGTLDWNAEVQLWTRAGMIKINLGRGIDIRYFDQLLAKVCL